jgi:hypothetical protein
MQALEVVQRHNLVTEQVFILGRMNRATEALRLIVNDLEDLPRAIAFVGSQNDDSLWDELISLVTSNADLTGQLLDQVGGFVDPLRLVKAIPDHLKIPQLHGRLSSIIKLFRSSVQLKQRCNDIIEADCMMLAEELLRTGQQPLQHIVVWNEQGGERGQGHWQTYDALTGSFAPCVVPPALPENIAAFAAPEHMLGASPHERLAASRQERRHCGGSRALAAPQSWGAVKMVQAGRPSASQGLRIWSVPR